MRGIRSDPLQPFAPLPASVKATRIGLGSWFQHRPQAVKIFAILGVLAGLAYFSFRIVATSDGVPLLSFAPLFLAEFFGFVTFVILVIEAWSVPATPRPDPLDLDVDVVITTYDEDVDILEPTVIGALRLRGKTTIYISDDKNRPEIRELAEKYAVTYHSRRSNTHAKAGNINTILPRLTGDLLLVLDADHVPAPDFLEATSGYFRQTKMALVQTAHSFRNHNSVMHEEEGRHEQSLFFDVLLPGRNRLESVFWCGSAALIRLSALRDIGGMATQSVTEDFETSLVLQKKGYLIKYHNEHLVQALAPDNIESYLIQRFRWARGTLTVFRPGIALPWSRELKFTQKISYLGALLYYLTPVQRLVYAVNFILVGIFGFLPLSYQGGVHLWVWGLWIGLSLFAVTALDRGTSHPFEGTRNVMLSMGVFLRALPALFVNKSIPFVVTPKNQLDAGGLGALRWVALPIALGAMVLIILGVRWAEILAGSAWPFPSLPELSLQAVMVISVFGLVDILIIAGFVRALWLRRQERVLWRFPVQLPATLGSHTAVCVDLHQSGAGLHVPAGSVTVGSAVPISLETRQLNGKIFIARGTLEPRNIRPIANTSDTVRVGGVITWATPRSRAAVIEHCYVVEPFLARNRQWTRQSPRASVDFEGALAGAPVKITDISIGGAALVTSALTPSVGQAYPFDVELPHGDKIRAPFVVRNVVTLETGELRVGGSVDWPETGWLSTYINLSFSAREDNRAFAAFSPLL